METTQKKLDRLDELITDREKVMEAKMKRLMKEAEKKAEKRVAMLEGTLAGMKKN